MIASKYDIGVIGMAVMGRNLAYNLADHGHGVLVWNLEPDLSKQAVIGYQQELVASAKTESKKVLENVEGYVGRADSLKQLVLGLNRPRTILLMIKAGLPVDQVIRQLVPLLESGDCIVDGGNSWFGDTIKRENALKENGIVFLGMGVSGGEAGARFGPSLMSGGDLKTFERLKPLLSSIAAKTADGPCVTLVGANGAGHFVKMVHNGIEYALMQQLAEVYHLLRDVFGLAPPQLKDVFAHWQQGPLKGYLVGLSEKIFEKKDTLVENYAPNSWLIDAVLDKAEQKGTGAWTVKAALDLGVPVPSIAAAVDARSVCALKQQRAVIAAALKRDERQTNSAGSLCSESGESWLDKIHDGLYGATIIAFAQGFALLDAGARQFGWAVSKTEIARIWKGGCIIRSSFLDQISAAYDLEPELENLMLAQGLRQPLLRGREALVQVVSMGLTFGIPMPSLGAGLGYMDGLASERLPQNLTQAQRDAFGAHTYVRNDNRCSGPVHSDWFVND